jgi:hypothetical protein
MSLQGRRAQMAVAMALAVTAMQTTAAVPVAGRPNWPQPRSRNQEKAARRKAKKRGKR